MTRRQILATAGTAAFAQQPHAGIPVIDTHIHLFDPNRPQGIPWPPKDNAKLYKPALPDRYRQLVAPFGVRGAIMVECSPWFDDNQWVLDVIGKDKLMVGMIGNLEPDHADFGKHLDRFSKNRLYLGIRYGNLWGRDFTAKVNDAKFIDGVKALAAAGLTLDTANPSPKLIADLVRLTDKVPNLRLVIDHLPGLNPPPSGPERKEYDGHLARLAGRPQVFVKLSAVLRRIDGRVPEDPAIYRPRLDELFALFGEDRVVYGSDWPNSDNLAEYPAVFSVVRDYFSRKSRAVAEKYFWRNSIKAYRWKKRDAGQPG